MNLDWKYENDPFLPEWTYLDQEFFEKELQCFHESWQLFCHIGEIAEVKDSLSLPWGGYELTVSRHEHSVFLADYLKDGHLLRGKTSVVEGFIFVSISGNESTLAKDFGPFVQELGKYHVADCVPVATADKKMLNVNWKRLMEIALDDTHISTVHPELAFLMSGAGSYVASGFIRRWDHSLSSKGVRHLGALLYLGILNWQRRLVGDSPKWVFYWIFPGSEIELLPEQISYCQVIPISPSVTFQRSCFLSLPSNSIVSWILGKLGRSIWRLIDSQDVKCVLRNEKKQGSIETPPKTAVSGDGLVIKFHRMIYESVRSRFL